MVDIYLSASDKKFVVNKDPQATLDYTWDWTEYLTAISDTISTASITVDSGIVVQTQTITGNNRKVVAFISGGELGRQHVATCKIVTTGGRTDERSIYFNIVNR